MKLSRRRFQKLLASAGPASIIGCTVSVPSAKESSGKSLLTGCAIGDVTSSGAVLWTRTEEPCQILLSMATNLAFTDNYRSVDIGNTDEQRDFNLKFEIKNLPASSQWYFRLEATSLGQPDVPVHFVQGQFQTADSDQRQNIRFCWGGDTAGQGWGVPPLDDSSLNLNQGMLTYAAMLSHKPQFFVHSGDQIYADGPIQELVELDNGQIWENLVTPAKSKVAESLQDFRENFYYNYLNSHYRDFHVQTPIYYQWDDHEVINNWYPREKRDDPRYQTDDISSLARRAKQALFECNPIRTNPDDPERIYRKIERGPLLDLFFLDMRSYRGPNSLNRQTAQSLATDFLGNEQIEWLKHSLKESKAVWKIICADMPLSAVVTDWGTDIAENAANGDDGPPLGRELEIAELLSFIKEEEIHNLHFITADVHYCASTHYHPDRAAFKNFLPFWEHISGPIHAGTFAPGKMDKTFGPERVFCGVPDDLPPNRPPSEPYQFFGKIDIDAETQTLTVSHYNSRNNLLWSKIFQVS